MAASGNLWALRMPGGPTRVIRSAVELSEMKAKAIYAGSIRHKAALVLRDKEAIWPLQKVIDDTEFSKDYSQFALLSNLTGLPRGVIEVDSKGVMVTRKWPAEKKLQEVQRRASEERRNAAREKKKQELAVTK